MKMKLRLFIEMLRGSFTRRVLGPFVYGLLVKTNHGLFAVDPEDSVVGRRLRITGDWGGNEIERLKPHIGLDSGVLVVGAHIGTLAIPISKLCKNVVAIEANPITYGFLAQNILLNAASNCTALNVAASDKEENIKFLLNRSNSAGSKRVPVNKEYIYYYDHPEEISVKAVSLDRYLESRDFDVVIMDIEGSEYYALKGMQEILSNCKLLAVEFLPHHLRNVSSVTVEEFLSVIAPHFSRLTIPSKNATVDVSNFLIYLSEMYDNEEGDDGLLFEKK